MDSTTVFIIFLGLMVLQVIGTHLQVKQYRKAVRRLHALGNIGIGSKKYKLRPGSIVVIGCDCSGIVTGGEIMQGFTIFNGFHELKGIVGKTIYVLMDEYKSLPKNRQKFYQAHIQALEALDLRLNPVNETV